MILIFITKVCKGKNHTKEEEIKGLKKKKKNVWKRECLFIAPQSAFLTKKWQQAKARQGWIKSFSSVKHVTLS